MAELLLSHKELGCTVNCGPNFTNECMSEGESVPYASVNKLEVVKHIWAEAKEKEQQECCVPRDWDALKINLPP